MEEVSETHNLDDYLRFSRFPHIWCSGCGLGIILHTYARALKETNFELDDVVTISGIGCAGRSSSYVKTDSFHTTHGRAVAFATGVKIANPELKPVIISGDGDLFAIGGNHIIHAARRNLDMLVLCANNFSYGMTGGQYGPTTPSKAYTTTSPYGNVEHPFNLVSLMVSAGASFVSRWTVYQVSLLKESMKKALKKKGFSFIEVVSPCPIGYGRLNRLGSALEMMKQIRAISTMKRGVHPTEAYIDPEKEIIVGDFIDVEKPTYCDKLESLLVK